MKSKLRARTPIIALTLIGLAALFIAACTTNEVEIPGLTGPSGSRLFITIEASPDKLFIRTPNRAPSTSRITLQLKNQLGEGVPNARIAVRITNVEGSEVGIGDLDHLTVVTDSGGFARLTYTAPSTLEQPVPVTVYLRAILTDPAFAFEVVSSHALDLQLGKDFDCVGGPGSPDVSFTFTPTAPAEDEQVCFDAQATTDNGSIVSFTWTFGDGSTDSGPVACHIFRSQGQFQVTLTVVDSDANCVSVTQLVNVGEGGAPTCSFTASPNPVSTDTVVLFNASASQDADGNIVSYSWNFGDGSTGSGETTSHIYNNDGSFTVTLTVRDNAGNETVCTQTVTVGVGIPTCSFTIDPDPAAVGEEVTFDASGSSDPQGSPLTFAWDLDNNGAFDNGSSQIVTFTYTTPGVKVVTLRVTDIEGNVSTCTDTVTIGNTPPVCESFTADQTNIEPGETVNFTVIASDPDAGDVLSVQFTTTGGTPGGFLDTAAPFSHSAMYNNEGTFQATATVSDDAVPAGTDDCPPITITVAEPEPTTITGFAPEFACPGDNITITGTGFTGSTGVNFDGTASPSFLVVNDTSIQAEVPTPGGDGDGPIVVLNPNGNASSGLNAFNTITDATVASYNPVSGLAGAAIQITGTNFEGAQQVLFTGAGGNCTVSSGANVVSDTQINTTVPGGAIDGPICVVNACGDTSAEGPNFDVLP